MERRADRNFVGRSLIKRWRSGETALKKEENVQNQAVLHLKIARLYFMVRDYSWAIGHTRRRWSWNGICSSWMTCVITLMRCVFKVRHGKAEAICPNNAYKDQYSRYQRYQNTLEALAMRHSVQEFPRFTAKRLS